MTWLCFGPQTGEEQAADVGRGTSLSDGIRLMFRAFGFAWGRSWKTASPGHLLHTAADETPPSGDTTEGDFCRTFWLKKQLLTYSSASLRAFKLLKHKAMKLPKIE